jgi:hypothetical protein
MMPFSRHQPIAFSLPMIEAKEELTEAEGALGRR